MEVLDISSDEDLGLEAIAGGSGSEDNFEWIKEVLQDLDTFVQDDDDDDDVVVIGEVLAPPRKRRNCSRTDYDDDCVVLNGDPDKPKSPNPGAGQVQTLVGGCESDDLVIVGEKGQVACRDYPHSRHLCVKFPFSSTLHVDYCNMCHCYVCDTPAPCDEWGTGITPGDHCHAYDKDEFWKSERKRIKGAQSAALKPYTVSASAPLVSKTKESSTQVQRPIPLSVGNTSSSRLLPQLSRPLREPALMSSPDSNRPASIPQSAHRAQQSSYTQVPGPAHLSSPSSNRHALIFQLRQQVQQSSTLAQAPSLLATPNSIRPVRVSQPHSCLQAQQSLTQDQGPSYLSAQNSTTVPAQTQQSSTHVRGATHLSSPNSTSPGQIPGPVVSAHRLPNIISRGRPSRTMPLSVRSHKYQPQLVSHHLSTSQNDHHRETTARILHTAPPSTSLLRKHQTAGTPVRVSNKPSLSYRNVNHAAGSLTRTLSDTNTSTSASLSGNLIPSGSLGQTQGRTVFTDKDLHSAPAPWLNLKQRTSILADEISHNVADTGPLLTSTQPSNHILLPNSPFPATGENDTMFPTTQNTDGSANPVYSPNYFDQFLENCFDGSMNYRNDDPPAPSSVSADPVDWPYLDVERTWNELAHS